MAHLEYFNNLLMFFNVSKIPPIYNNTIFYNITGNNEIYLVDVYNALGYSQFNKVPFGNEYYFNPTDNKTIYFYLNMTKQPIPYVGQTLYFTSANYVPVIRLPCGGLSARLLRTPHRDYSNLPWPVFY